MIPWKSIFEAIVEIFVAPETETGIVIWTAIETVIETMIGTVVGTVTRTASMSAGGIVTVILLAIVILTTNIWKTTSERRDTTRKEFKIAATAENC